MSNVCDGVLGEKVGKMILPFASRNFGLKIVSFEPLPEKIQLTRDREVDFAAKVKTEEGKELIFHVEAQVRNDPNLHLRMLDYHASLVLKYRMAVFQAVVYLGRALPTFPTQLQPHEIMREFHLVDVGRTTVDQALDSQTPEKVILGVLADFEGEDRAQVIEALTWRIVRLAEENENAEKFLQQLARE